MAVVGNDGATTERHFCLQSGIVALEDAVLRIECLRLIIVDPISAYLGSTDSHKNAEMRGLLSPLSQFAAKHKIAVLCMDHLSKSTKAAIYRPNGSIALTAAARAVWAVASDPADSERKLFLPVKQNLSRDGGGLAFRIEETQDEVPRIAWEPGTVTENVNDILNLDGEDGPIIQDAKDWLRDLLSQGPVLAKEAEKAASAAGISRTTLHRARRSIADTKKLGGRGEGFEWKLRESKIPTPKNKSLESLESLSNSAQTNIDSVEANSKIPSWNAWERSNGNGNNAIGPWIGPPPKPIKCTSCGVMQPSAVALAHHSEVCGSKG